MSGFRQYLRRPLVQAGAGRLRRHQRRAMHFGRHAVKVEEQPRRGQMLVDFLADAGEAPEALDARFAGQKAIDLEQFSPICDNMK